MSAFWLSICLSFCILTPPSLRYLPPKATLHFSFAFRHRPAYVTYPQGDIAFSLSFDSALLTLPSHEGFCFSSGAITRCAFQLSVSRRRSLWYILAIEDACLKSGAVTFCAFLVKFILAPDFVLISPFNLITLRVNYSSACWAALLLPAQRRVVLRALRAQPRRAEGRCGAERAIKLMATKSIILFCCPPCARQYQPVVGPTPRLIANTKLSGNVIFIRHLISFMIKWLLKVESTCNIEPF